MLARLRLLQNNVREKVTIFLDRPDNRWFLGAKISAVASLSIALFLAVVITDLRSRHHSSSSLVGFQPSSKGRSTMDIVYACVTTMVICTISAVHIDLPFNTSHRLEFGEKLFTIDFWLEMARKVVIWSIALLMPEVAVFWASKDYFGALKDQAYMKTKFDSWTFKHSMFAIMKGFALRVDESRNRPSYQDRGDPDDSKRRNFKDLMVAVTRRFRFSEDGYKEVDSGRRLLGRGAVLNDKICEQLGHEISDKSKADVLTKLISIVQITRFLLETIARAANALPISPLEYFTCAQVFCALLMYIFWFDKPHGVQEKIRLETHRRTRSRSARNGPARSASRIPNTTVVKQWKGMLPFASPNALFFLIISLIADYSVYPATTYAAIMIGASVLASWNQPFPNVHLRALWKALSVISFIMPIATTACLWLCGRVISSRYEDTCFFVVAAVHCSIRLAVIFLIFYSFRSLPSGVYETESWLDFVPFFH